MGALPPIGNNPNFQAFGVLNGQLPLPAEGPRVMPLLLDFSQAASYLLDMKLAQQQARMSFVQTVFIDNSLSLTPFTLESQIIGQNIIIPAGGQGFIPVMALQSPVLTASSTGGVVVPIFLMNFPVSPAVWIAEEPLFSMTAGGFLKVSDVALDALISNWNAHGQALAVADLGLQSLIQTLGATPGLNVNVVYGGGSSGASATLIASGLLNTAGGNIYSAAAGAANRWYITGVHISASGDIALAAGTNTFVSIQARYGLLTAVQRYFKLPVAATGVDEILFSQSFSTPLRMDTLNDQITCLVNNTLTTGNFDVLVFGFAAP